MSPATPSAASLKSGSVTGRCRVAVIFAAASVLLFASLLPSCNLLGTAAGLGLAKLQFGCLPQGTRIDTAAGFVEIENLKTGDLITGFHGDPIRITQIHQYQEDPATSRYLTVHFANGSAVSTSPRHRIAGTPAAALQAGDHCGSSMVTRIEPLHGVSRSFDLLTEDPGYRIGGIPVNSMIAEMSNR